jgi:hypothetical protein
MRLSRTEDDATRNFAPAIIPAPRANCPSGETCTISLQLIDHNNDLGKLERCPWKLGGNDTAEQGPFIGQTLTDNRLSGGTLTDQESGVTAGKHAVPSFVFVQDASVIGS